MGKLPYIPNKKMYAAVMGACSYVRETGWFNKATQYYADKYDVDVEEVRKYVRMASSAGRKEANKKKGPVKYSWYAVEYSYGSERLGAIDCFYQEFAEFAVCKATSRTNVIRRVMALSDRPSEYCWTAYPGRIWACETQAEAEQLVEEWIKERDALRDKKLDDAQKGLGWRAAVTAED